MLLSLKYFGPVCLLFLKTVFYSQKQRNKENMFGFQCIFVLKNSKKTKFKEQEELSENTKMMLFVFSNTVFKNSF